MKDDENAEVDTDGVLVRKTVHITGSSGPFRVALADGRVSICRKAGTGSIDLTEDELPALLRLLQKVMVERSKP